MQYLIQDEFHCVSPAEYVGAWNDADHKKRDED